MIYIFDFNSSLDYKIYLANEQINTLNRFSNYQLTIGGKGINNALVFNNLGQKTTLFGFNGGFIGQQISKLLKDKPLINYQKIKLNNNNRINVKLFLKKKDEIEINGDGPEINDDNILKMINKINDVKKDDVVFLVGSKPQTKENIFALIAKEVKSKKAKLVIDTNRDTLLECLKYNPFVIKPNLFELNQLFNVKIKDDDFKTLIKYCLQLIKQGSLNVILSLGKKGALLVLNNGQVFLAKSPTGEVVNTIGSGDSLLSSFVYYYLLTKDFKKALQYGVAAGSASAFSKHLATKKEIDSLYEKIIIEELKYEN